MKPSIALALLLGFASTSARGETFIGPTTATNRLLVPSNSAIIITATFGNFTNSTQLAFGVAGHPQPMSYFAPLQNGTEYALAGPAELVFTNAALITYYVVTNSAIITQAVANDPIPILIASNKTMRLFGVSAPVNMAFSRSGTGVVQFTLQPNQPAEFTGPGELFFNRALPAPDIEFFSYFIAEDGFAIPNQRFIAGPTGSFAVTVEKSFDLNAWQPVLLENTSDANHAFYRLKIQQ